MPVHDTLSLDSRDKVRVQVVNLQIGVLCLDDVPIQVIWLESLGCLRQATQEVVQRLLVLIASSEVVLEVRVDLLALLHKLAIILKGGLIVLENFVKALYIALKVALDALSPALSLAPYLELCLEVSESLSDQLDVQNARQTFLCLAERRESLLEDVKFKLDVFSSAWTIFARARTITTNVNFQSLTSRR